MLICLLGLPLWTKALFAVLLFVLIGWLTRKWWPRVSLNELSGPVPVGIGILIVVSAVWVGSYFVVTQLASSSRETAGQIGDSFGAVNALFSGLAFAGVIFVLYVEQRDRDIAPRRATTLQCYERLIGIDLAGVLWKATTLTGSRLAPSLEKGATEPLHAIVRVLTQILALLRAGELHLPLAQSLILMELYDWKDHLLRHQLEVLELPPVPQRALMEISSELESLVFRLIDRLENA